jgi:hypothetical protein
VDRVHRFCWLVVGRDLASLVDWFGYTLGVIAILCVLLPPRYDPAIRLKEWMDGWSDDC